MGEDKRMLFTKANLPSIRVLVFFLFLLSQFSAVAAAPVDYSGAKLEAYEQSLSQVFPEGEKFKETVVTPKELGGTTFVGLVARLLGERPHRTYEGISTPRVIYEVFKDKKIVGIAHGVTVDMPSGPAEIFVFYDLDGSIKNLRVDKVPEHILKKLHEGNYIQQFIGYKVEDFEKQARYKRSRGRKHTYWNKGKFLTQAKTPAARELKPYWEKIVRSVRFNAAFMDVAFFITRHPELDTHKRISNKAVSGPEKEVEGAQVIAPEGSNRMIIKPADAPAVDPASSN